MSYIDAVPEDGPLDELQERIFAAARRRFTFVPDVVRVLAIRAEVAQAQALLRDALLGSGCTIGARRADLVALAVSGLNGCRYCGTAHAGTMVARGDMALEDAAALVENWRALDLEPGDVAMLEFAEKLTFDPGSIREEDVACLRAAGFDEAGIYDIVLLTAYRNFINRVNDGFGVSTGKLRDHFGDEVAEQVAASLGRTADRAR